MNLESRITSIRDTLQGSYVKPAPGQLGLLRKALDESERGKDYLHITRGLSPDTISNFCLGYDADKDAIAIPVFKRGELVNIRYRYIEPKGNSKYTQEKGAEVWLYNEDGIAQGQKKGGVLIVEGEFDCMSAWQAGFKNVISPASGKDSYGIWLELLDTIPKVYIGYDNDKPGKAAGYNLAERVGVDKSFEVLYPDGVKDANDYFKANDAESYKGLLREARPYYRYTYAGIDSVIEAIRQKGETRLKLDCLPFVKLDDDWMIIVSGVSGIGKTSYVMNIANELMNREIPTLVLPFERGTKTVGGRFIQVRCEKTEDELINFNDEEWKAVIPDLINLPLYFSLPTHEEVKEVIEKAKRLFGIKVVIVDHLDYSILPTGNNSEVSEMKKVLQNWKTICLENNIIFIVVHHIRKQDNLGTKPKKPRMEDLKGGSASYQVPEAVVMLSKPEGGKVEIDVIKNKGDEGSRIYEFNSATGKVGNDITELSRLNPGEYAMTLDDI